MKKMVTKNLEAAKLIDGRQMIQLTRENPVPTNCKNIKISWSWRSMASPGVAVKVGTTAKLKLLVVWIRRMESACPDSAHRKLMLTTHAGTKFNFQRIWGVGLDFLNRVTPHLMYSAGRTGRNVHAEVREPPWKSILSPSYIFWGSNSSCQAWNQAPLITEPSQRSNLKTLDSQAYTRVRALNTNGYLTMKYVPKRLMY